MEESGIAHVLTGMVAGGLGVDPDFDSGAVDCDGCRRNGTATTLTASDRVVVAVRNYEGHTWEPVDLFCTDHGVETVEKTMGIDADDQAVVAATLEPTGYQDPLGDHHPNALSLGGLEVLDFSPAGDGY